MKKLFSLLLVAALVLGLSACVKPKEEEPTTEPTTTQELVTDENGNAVTTTDINTAEITTKEPPVTVAPTEDDTTTTKPPASTNAATTTTAKPKATLYPASDVIKGIKSGKYYMEYNFSQTADGQTQTQQIVRASDGDKQYMRAVSGGNNVAFLKDTKNINIMIPKSLITQSSDDAATKAFINLIGAGKQGAVMQLPIAQMQEYMGDEFIDEINSVFGMNELMFTEPGSFQSSGTATGSDGTKYNVETFKDDTGTTKFYFAKESGELKLVSKTVTDGTTVLAGITTFKTTVDDAYFTVPSNYFVLDESGMEQLSKLLTMFGN
jgi:hypothetical protein